MKKLLVFVFALLWISSIVLGADAETVKAKIHGTSVTITTKDNLVLHGWLTPSPHGEGPLWVLLPMLGHTHTSYNPFIKALYERFKTPDSSRALKTLPHILALDLRGHGESTKLGATSINYRDMQPEDFAHYPSDVAAMIDTVLRRADLKIDQNGVVIIGASIGANTTVMAGQMVKGVSAAVMLSPGENYRSLEPAQALTDFPGKVLILAATEDAYSKTSSEKLASLKPKGCTLKIFTGPYHGTDLIDNEAGAMKFMIDWLVSGK